MRLTFGAAKSTLSRSAAGGVCPDDLRLIDRVNEAIMRLLPKGDWVNTTATLRYITGNNFISLPSKFETLIGFKICGRAGYVHNQYYSYTGTGPGHGDGHLFTGHGSDQGYFPTQNDICPGPQYLAVYADVTEATGAQLLVKGYDQNWNRIRTFVNGSWIDGIYINLVSPGPTVTSQLFNKIEALIKPVTNASIRVYQQDPTSGAQALLAILEAEDTAPQFRRYVLPGLQCQPWQDGNAVPPTTQCVDVIAKLAFRPVVDDNSELLIQNLGALKVELRALELEELDLLQGNALATAQGYEMKAIELLNEELKNYYGKGSINNLRIQGGGWAVGQIVAPI